MALKQDHSLTTEIPLKHLAIIMDGNGRWATGRKLPRIHGHAEGAKRVMDIAEASLDAGIQYLSLFAFSTENWKRSPQEVKGLFKLLDEFAVKYEKNLHENQTRLMISGNLTPLPSSSQKLLKKLIDATKGYTKRTLNICINYGGKDDIVMATKLIVDDVINNRLDIKNLNEETFAQYLYTKDMPAVDLLIRTSGEERLSNFLLYQIAYAELIFVPTFWPDFTKEKLQEAIAIYYQRKRKFGASQ
jgi:undecaprenyl diphosphate synthase